jgi:hypothetical protein
MFSDLFSFSGLLAIQFGYAAFLGALASYARQSLDRALMAASILFYAGASLALPMATSYKVVIWIVSALLFWGFRSSNLVVRNQPRLGWLYAAFAMVLIIAWSITQPAQPPFVILAASAGLAAALAWRRSLAI